MPLPRASACLGLVIDAAFASSTANRSRPIDTQRVAEPTTPSRSDRGQTEVFPAVPGIPRAANRRADHRRDGRYRKPHVICSMGKAAIQAGCQSSSHGGASPPCGRMLYIGTAAQLVTRRFSAPANDQGRDRHRGVVTAALPFAVRPDPSTGRSLHLAERRHAIVSP